MSQNQGSIEPGPIKCRKAANSVSPEKKESQLQNFSCGRCSKCKENCTTESEAIQCDLCYAWVHAQCDSISSELYSSLNNILLC